ncbi:MAG: A/G-specific adenine glycosylase [Cyclobacteriaceae bacterium]|nr:A/G-specific adenine glycosylase [Cyclobacteriaceae bacterium]MCH8517374.1 A/G-specific adenine glycosylase [Cyclobacteriaceae bacterium]
MEQQNFSELILSWYASHQRDLPWRKTSSPYKIWLSEVILQQTRVAQGLSYYERFIERFPTIHSLATATEEEVLKEWEGLGYYSRARNLHACANQVVQNYAGEFPRSYQELLNLKGIGHYTAAAIASIAFNKKVPVVDGNVYRLLARYLGIHDDISQTKSRLIFFEAAAELMKDTDNPGDFNQAMMELGATICTPKNSLCHQCPLQQKCYAIHHNKISHLPVKLKKVKVKTVYSYYFVFMKNEEFIISLRGPNSTYAGMYDFPQLEWNKKPSWEAIHDTFYEKLSVDKVSFRVGPSFKHILTHRKIYATFVEVEINSQSTWETILQRENFQAVTKATFTSLPKSNLIGKYLNYKK